MSAPYSSFSVSINLRAASDTLTRSAAKAITSAIGRLRGFEMPDHFGFLGKERGDRALGRVDNVVAVLYGKLAVDLQTEFDKGAVARVPRTKTANPPRAGTGDCRRFDAFALLIRQLVIQKLAGCSHCDVPSTHDHVAGDHE